MELCLGLLVYTHNVWAPAQIYGNSPFTNGQNHQNLQHKAPIQISLASNIGVTVVVRSLLKYSYF